MKIIDIHAHLERDPLTKRYKYMEFLQDMTDNGIERRVVSALDGKSIRDQNDTVIQFVRQNPDRLTGAGVINPKEDDALEEVERISAQAEISMLEFNSLEHGYRPEKMQYILDPIFDYCSGIHMPVKVFTGHGFYTMPDQWAFYAKRFPDVTFIILHMGGSDFSYGTVDLCKEVPNLLLEMSYETEMQPLKRAFKEVEPERLLYGSNYYHNFTDLSILKYQVLKLDESVKKKLFCQNARQWFSFAD